MSYIFVDVDGVLNSFRPNDDTFEVTEKGFRLNLNPNHAEWLLNLSSVTGAELVWGSTWQELANECVGKHLGLPELPHLVLSPSHFSETLESIKARAAISYAKREKFVYFDDLGEISSYMRTNNGLLIQVNPHYGLGKHHIEKAERFLNS